MISPWVLALAMLIEALAGWPEALNRHISHPVAWLGRLIALLEKLTNAGTASQRLWNGVLTTLLVLLVASVAAFWIDGLLPDTLIGDLVRALLIAVLLATRNLYDHVAAVAVPLRNGDMVNARARLSEIVGRNPEELDEAGLSRAAIETLAENSSDGVIAPLFWAVLFGLPGIVIYKAINTLDSMIGYRSKRFEQFGKLAARLDDVANWLPARLTALLFLSMKPAAFVPGARLVLRDAPKHRSLNAGWPEAAMAALVGVRLSGPRSYHGKISSEPWLNERGRQAAAEDIGFAMMYYRRAMLIAGIGFLGAAGVVWLG